jgi:hypothetical protein
MRGRFRAESISSVARRPPGQCAPRTSTHCPICCAGISPRRGRNKAPIRFVRLKQRGRIRSAPGGAWMPFASEQVLTLEPPGFVWLARARVAPLASILVQDELVQGRGNMLVRLLGLWTMADARGPEIDQGSALRFWGEALAIPESAASPRLRWEAIDDRRARFTATGEGPPVSATVEFDAQGLPVAIHAERYRDVRGKGVLTPWSGHLRDWTTTGERVFPMRWESVWHLPDGDFTAVTMEILSVETG